MHTRTPVAKHTFSSPDRLTTLVGTCLGFVTRTTQRVFFPFQYRPHRPSAPINTSVGPSVITVHRRASSLSIPHPFLLPSLPLTELAQDFHTWLSELRAGTEECSEEAGDVPDVTARLQRLKVASRLNYSGYSQIQFREMFFCLDANSSSRWERATLHPS